MPHKNNYHYLEWTTPDALSGGPFPREWQAEEILHLGSNGMCLSVANGMAAPADCVPSKPALNFSEPLTRSVGRLLGLLFVALQHT